MRFDWYGTISNRLVGDDETDVHASRPDDSPSLLYAGQVAEHSGAQKFPGKTHCCGQANMQAAIALSRDRSRSNPNRLPVITPQPGSQDTDFMSEKAPSESHQDSAKMLALAVARKNANTPGGVTGTGGRWW